MGAAFVGHFLGADQGVSKRLFGFGEGFELLLEEMHTVIEVGAFAPHGLVRVGGIADQLVNVGAAVTDQAQGGSFMSEFYG